MYYILNIYLIKHFEGGFNFVFGEHVGFVDGGHDPLGVVNVSWIIDIDLGHEMVDYVLGLLLGEDFPVAVEYLLPAEQAISIDIETLEDFHELGLFVATGEEVDDEGVGLLLKLGLGLVLFDVVVGLDQRLHVQILLHVVFQNPLVLQSFSSSHPVLRLVR